MGRAFAHPCALRVVTTMLARRLGDDPRSVPADRARAANLEVARLAGALDRPR